nr:unnamed protein product [Callosobruchus analis]
MSKTQATTLTMKHQVSLPIIDSLSVKLLGINININTFIAIPKTASQKFGYCSHVWGYAPKHSLKLLGSIQNRAFRLIDAPNLTKDLQNLEHPCFITVPWVEESFTNFQKGINWRSYVVCDVAYNNVNNWLWTPFIERNVSNRMYIEIKFTIRDCSLFPGNALSCKETFSLLYYEFDAVTREPPPWNAERYKLISDTQVKAQLIQDFKNRLTRLLKTQLNSRNLTKAINTFAIPVLTYSFDIIKWSHTDIENIHILIRSELTKHRMSHPNACKERLTINTKQGGRGIIDIQSLHTRQIKLLRKCFQIKQTN